MRKLQIIACVTNELRYWWETAVYLHNLTNLGYRNINILVFIKKGEHPLFNWEELQEKFQDVKFWFKEDDKNIYKISQAFRYTPLYRFWLLQEYFREFPELENDAILYTDTDIIFTKYLDFDKFLKDDINYLSWTGNKERTDNYLWQPYFDNKINQVNPSKLEQYKQLDIISHLGFACNTTREIITQNNPNTGGAQYLLKNINSQFWIDCFNTCCEIKTYLADINQIFFKGNTPLQKENNGFQSFCADMISLLYNLWGNDRETKCPKEFDFAWSTDYIDRIVECGFIHNAGITKETNNKVAFEKKETNCKQFFKGKYQNFTPFDDESTLNEIINNPASAQFCNAIYVKEILKTNKYLNQKP